MDQSMVPAGIRLDGFGFSNSPEEDTVNALTECGLPLHRARHLVVEHGVMGALSAAKNEAVWNSSQETEG